MCPAAGILRDKSDFIMIMSDIFQICTTHLNYIQVLATVCLVSVGEDALWLKNYQIALGKGVELLFKLKKQNIYVQMNRINFWRIFMDLLGQPKCCIALKQTPGETIKKPKHLFQENEALPIDCQHCYPSPCSQQGAPCLISTQSVCNKSQIQAI